MTNIKKGTTPGRVTPNKKAAGGIQSTTATSSVSLADSNGIDPAQFHLDLDDDQAQKKGEVTSRISARTPPDTKPGTKLAAILGLFVMGRNLNRFEAEDHHDHCLHSTVSTLQNDYGIKIARQFETIPCLRGRSSVRCMRYWLDTSLDNIAAARVLLAMLGGRA